MKLQTDRQEVVEGERIDTLDVAAALDDAVAGQHADVGVDVVFDAGEDVLRAAVFGDQSVAVTIYGEFRDGRPADVVGDQRHHAQVVEGAAGVVAGHGHHRVAQQDGGAQLELELGTIDQSVAVGEPVGVEPVEGVDRGTGLEQGGVEADRFGGEAGEVLADEDGRKHDVVALVGILQFGARGEDGRAGAVQVAGQRETRAVAVVGAADVVVGAEGYLWVEAHPEVGLGRKLQYKAAQRGTQQDKFFHKLSILV